MTERTISTGEKSLIEFLVLNEFPTGHVLSIDCNRSPIGDLKDNLDPLRSSRGKRERQRKNSSFEFFNFLIPSETFRTK